VKLAVTGKFVLDEERNPPPLRSIEASSVGEISIPLGRGVDLLLRPHANLLDRLLDSRVKISEGFTGLGSIEGGCSVFCTSNWCREWARRMRRPRIVAKVVGVMADEATFVLLSQPRLLGAQRGRRETRVNRVEAGLAPFVLIEPGAVECTECPGRNMGEVRVVIV